MPTQRELRSQINQRIMDALKNEVVPWRCPWQSCGGVAGPHRNVVSRRTYSGINIPLLTLSAAADGYRSPLWATYRQWTEIGGQVKRGSKGTPIIFYRTVEKEPKSVSPAGQDERPDRIFLLRSFVVFNLDQVQGERLDKYRPAPPTEQPVVFSDWEPAERAIAATGADIRFVAGDRAYYVKPLGGTFPHHSGGDYIQLPERKQFPDMRDFYATQFHELAHWTACRLDRDGSYAMEELVAEMTAAYVANELRVPQSDDLTNHAVYLKSWLKAMENDPKWIFQASTQASRAADFILAFSRSTESEQQPEPASSEAA